MQDIEQFERAVCNFFLRLQLKCANIAYSQMECNGTAQVFGNCVHVQLVVKQLALLV